MSSTILYSEDLRVLEGAIKKFHGGLVREVPTGTRVPFYGGMIAWPSRLRH